MLEHYLLSIGLAFLMYVIVLYIWFTKFNINSKKRLIAAISFFLVVISLFFYRTYDSFNGRPQVMSETLDRAWVLSFYADADNEAIYLWLLELGKETPISYKIPYSEPMHKKLDKLRDKYKGRPYLAKIKGESSITKPYGKGQSNGDDLLEIPITMPRKDSKQ